MQYRLPILILGLTVALRAQAPIPSAPAPPVPTFNNTVRPFLETSCQPCHNSKLKSGGLNFELLKYSATLAPQLDTWEKTAEVLSLGQMPPAKAPQPAPELLKTVIDVLHRDVAKAKETPANKTNPAPPTKEWLTWQADPERTGWARAETTLTKQNAPGLTLLWKSQLDAESSKANLYATLTDPLIVENVATRQGPRKVVYVASAENNVYALDVQTGTPLWSRKFPNNSKPPQPASGSCPNNLNATPVVDKKSGIIYVLTTDGKLRGLGLSDGDDRMAPAEFVAPYSRNWSLNLIDNFIYTATSRGCAGAVSNIVAIDVAKPNHPVVAFYPSTGKASGPWGRGGIVRTPFGVVTQTADGAYDPAAGRFGNTFLGLSRDLRLTDSYTPANEAYLNKKDFDLGAASPTVFQYEKWTLVASAAKEGVIYLLDASDLGGPDHRTPLYVSPRYGNDALIFGFTGVWGSLSTFVDAKNQRWLLVPMEGPPAKDTAASFKTSHGKVVNGSIMAFKLKTEKGRPVLEPVWMSQDLDLPGMPLIANGVVYVIATGDRARDKLRAPFTPGGRGPGPGRGPGRGVNAPSNQVMVGEPGAERDAAWLTAQTEPGGQVPGQRFSGGDDQTHAVLHTLDAETGQELYSSKDLIDSWNHYGGLALSDGRLYLSTYDARVYCFGLPK
jgi:outer membrane protein assembly factor BamB